MAVQAIKRGVDLCLKEVGDLRDWKHNFPGDSDCCIVPAPRLREQFALFAERIPQDFSMMNFFKFAHTTSAQVFCKSCKRQQCLDHLRLFDCLERHVRGQIEQMHDELPSLFNGLGEAIDPQPTGGQPRNLGAPFDRGDSDVTLRSCDHVDFQVHKTILAIASSVFEDMFTAPGSPPHGQGQAKQVIDLTENSKTLLLLLSVIYPMEPIVPDTLEDALSLLSACQKYQMDSIATRIRALIRTRTPPLFTAKNCFRAYGIASRYHLEEEALLSARLTLDRPMTFEVCGEALRFISGADLFRLYGYRNECTEVAKDCIAEMTDRPPSMSSRCSSRSASKGRYGKGELHTVPRWWHGHFFRRIADRPSPEMITDRLAFEHAIASHRADTGCPSCMPDENGIGNIICSAFEAKLSEVIEQVRLEDRT
ncbi:hypothetical protein BJY52DRAFT_1143954 [Lactarius psammicola]|nr:hypothetical protein BJY52DRAFT_1143954 [Lactarius psammicola]